MLDHVVAEPVAGERAALEQVGRFAEGGGERRDGVERECEPPPPIDGDVYALSDGAARRLPAALGEATDLLERSALAREWLGDDVVEHCVAMRRAELAAQAAAVTDWETARYLEAL